LDLGPITSTGKNMAESQKFDRLQRRTKMIAFVGFSWILFANYFVPFIVFNLMNVGKERLDGSNRQWYQNIGAWEVIIMCEVLGILSNIWLYIGATKGNKCFLIPFMVVYSIFLVLLFILIITLLCYGVIIYNLPEECPELVITARFKLPCIAVIIATIIFVVILMPVIHWMLRNVKDFFDEVGILMRQQSRSGATVVWQSAIIAPQYSNQIFPNSFNPHSSRNTVDLEASDAALQTNVPLPSINSMSEGMDNIENRGELPPPYDETCTVFNNTNKDIVPSYDEAMVMKKESENQDQLDYQ
jgi:hypothetical protein